MELLLFFFAWLCDTIDFGYLLFNSNTFRNFLDSYIVTALIGDLYESPLYVSPKCRSTTTVYM